MIKQIKQKLFSSISDSILTICIIMIMVYFLLPFLNWALFNANFSGSMPQHCTNEGACWVFIKSRFSQFMYGFYPDEHRWRINLAYFIGTLALLWLMAPNLPYKKIIAWLLLIPYPILAFILFYGGYFDLKIIETHLWGGLHLTLVIALTGIVLSLPLGVILALGRRSTLPIIRVICTAFIELWRGVPLISVLFMASVMLPLFLPENIYFDKLLRALIGVTLFSSAYMAEVIRGGLQAIPAGQYEAADALGLSYWQKMRLIILPQALKLVIPGIVNTFIGLFKDTTLVLIIGLFDLLGIVQAANTDPKWIKYNIEGYLFAGFGFWIFCFAMSRYSQYLEKRLAKGR